MASQLLATKSITELHEQESSGNQLRRALTATQLTLLGIGGVIGTGIFVLTGVAAAQNAGPALPLSFIVAGLGCTFAGLCYAEFAAMIPVSGSAYSYSYATLGEGIAWFIGWNLVLEYLFAVATVSVGWSGYARTARSGRGRTAPEVHRGHHQPARHIDRRRHCHDLLHRHQAVSRLQLDHRHHQGHGDRAVHPLRRELHQHRQLAPVRAAQRRNLG
jgi:hypothetical protein